MAEFERWTEEQSRPKLEIAFLFLTLDDPCFSTRRSCYDQDSAVCAMSCPVHEKLPTNPVPFFDQGEVNFKAHQVGWLLCFFFTLNAVGASIW